MPEPQVTFIVVNFNGGAMLRDCLDSLVAQSNTAFEVIVVDNGSKDRSAELPHFSKPGWRLIALADNQGFSRANNIAFEQSRAPFVALINNDVTLAPDWTEQMLRAFDDPRVGSAACRLVQHARPEWLDSAGFAYFTCATTTTWKGLPADAFRGKNHRPFGAVASAALYRRSALEKTGLFHDRYFAYYEDTDLSIRLRLHGYDCAYVDEAVGRHVGSATGKRQSPFHVYQLRRNVEWLFAVNMVGSLAFRYAVPHFIYESLAFAGALAAGRLGSFLRAKRDAFAAASWIRKQRAALRRSLDLPAATQNLRAAMTPGWRVFLRGRSR